MHPDTRRNFKDVIDQAGVQQIRFHDLRHTAASLMLNNNIPAIIVSKMMGHSRPSTTLDNYGHLITGMQDEAAKMMDEMTSLNIVDFSQKEEVKKVKDEGWESYRNIKSRGLFDRSKQGINWPHYASGAGLL